MSGSPVTRPAPDLPAERRLALVVATTTYADASLRRLRAPARDAADLSAVLADPRIGAFEVTPVIDKSAHEVRLAVENFLAERNPQDLLVVYLSCHGLVDVRRRLYFAATDSVKNRLAATGLEARWLLDQLEDCRARRQVVLLDCCFSGAFAHGAKGENDLGLAGRFQGHGRVVLTASRASEYSFEGDPVPGADQPGSVFTSALVDGLRTGAADLDHDGYVSVDDAYGYVFDRMRSGAAKQTPQRWLYGVEGQILLARSSAGITITPHPLPEALRSSLDSPYPDIRIGAVTTLGHWLDDSDPARALAARQAVRHIADTDIPDVAAAARALLDPHPETTDTPGTAAGRNGQEPTESPAPVEPPPDDTVPETPKINRPPPHAEVPPPTAGSPPRAAWLQWPRSRRSRVITAVLTALLLAAAIALPILTQAGDGTSPSPIEFRSVAFSPDGKTLASSDDAGSVRLWDLATGKQKGDPLASGSNNAINSVAFSHDGKTLAGSDDYRVRLWDLATGKQKGDSLTSDALGTINSVAFSPDDKTLAGGSDGSGANDGKVRIWDLATGKEKGKPLASGNAEVRSVAFSPDGKTLAGGSSGACCSSREGKVQLWDLATGKEKGKPLISGSAQGVWSVAFSHDGKTLAADCPEGVCLWDPATGKPKGKPLTSDDDDTDAAIFSVAFSPDGKTLAAAGKGNYHGIVQLWDPATGRAKGQPLTGQRDWVNSVAFSPDGKTLAGGGRDDIRLWDPATGKLKAKLLP
ncbi:caspase, EACC1-associated type [Streptomyces tanashiensis]|uniref:caspase, EACC1-associated type n=1 Tax=Streptomyces tanashiensis TaxID=67367 RepID=UPI00341A72BD